MSDSKGKTAAVAAGEKPNQKSNIPHNGVRNAGKSAGKNADKSAHKNAENLAGKGAGKPLDKTAENLAGKGAGKPLDKPVGNLAGKGATLTLMVEDLNNLGCGVAHTPEGKSVFIQGAVAGDTVRATLIKVNKTFAVAKLAAVLTPSPHRVEGFCSAALSCGGCVYRHLSYEKELELKRNAVVHAFKKAGVPEADITEVRSTGEIRGYRNKAEYPITGGKNGLYGGFYATKTHRVTEASSCALQPPIFGEILRATCAFFTAHGGSAYEEERGEGLLRHLYLREGKATGELMVVPVINGEALPHEEEYVRMLRTRFPRVSSVLLNIQKKNTNVVLGETFRTLYGKPYLEDVLRGLRFRIAPDAFYQVNHDGAELLYSIAAAHAAARGGGGLLLDLYCGAGTIGLSMAKDFSEVIGIEIVPAAVASATENAALNGIKNASFYCGDAAKAQWLLSPAETERGRLSPAVTVLDPPRKGCDEGLLRFLSDRRVPAIVYVSCNPATLARDAARLLSFGYHMEKVEPVDMFPRTGHVECVTSFFL